MICSICKGKRLGGEAEDTAVFSVCRVFIEPSLCMFKGLYDPYCVNAHKNSAIL